LKFECRGSFDVRELYSKTNMNTNTTFKIIF
jgi:hypothetical protein